MPNSGIEIRAWYCQGTRTATYDDICADDNGDNDTDDNLGDDSGRELDGDGSENTDAGSDGSDDGTDSSTDHGAMVEWICDDNNSFCHLLAQQEMTYLQSRRFCKKQGNDKACKLSPN